MIRVTARAIVSVSTVLTVLFVAAGCTSAVPGTGTAAPIRHAGQAQSATQLAKFLMARPAGAKTSGDAWETNETPSVDELAGQLYSDDPSVDNGAYLRELGITAIAHRAWYTADGSGAELYLLLFDSSDQLPEWMTQENSGGFDQGESAVTLGTDPFTEGFTFRREAGDDLTDTRLYTARGRIGVLTDVFTPGAFDPTLAKTWIDAQYALLG